MRMAEAAMRLLRRAALGLWFGAIAALGLLQFFMRAFDEGRFAPTEVAWLWLAGSVVLACIATGLLVRSLRKPL